MVREVGMRRSVPTRPCSSRMRSSRSTTSSASRTVTSDSPRCWACSDTSRWATAWKVPPHTRCAAAGSELSTAAREVMAAAARRVKVRSMSRSGCTPDSSSRATRAVSVRVLPVPAPAAMISGPPSCSAACSCSSLRPARQSCSIMCSTVDHHVARRRGFCGAAVAAAQVRSAGGSGSEWMTVRSETARVRTT